MTVTVVKHTDGKNYYRLGNNLVGPVDETTTKDAETPKRCEYRHDWIQASRIEIAGKPVIRCSKCGAFPKAKENEQAEAIVTLKSLLKPGDTVYTTLKHVSRSGMQRAIDVHILQVTHQEGCKNLTVYDSEGRNPEVHCTCQPKAEPRWIASLVAKALGWPFSEKYEAVKVDGCGMDLGFHLVYSLSRVLFHASKEGEFRCIGESCPSNDHNNWA